MKLTTLIHLAALPATFAKLLDVDIVAGTSYKGVMAQVKVESADQEPTILEADSKDNYYMTPEHWCLTGNRWTKFCNGLNHVQVLGHINFTEPAEESRIVNMSTLDLDGATSWTASCDITVTGNMTLFNEERIENVVWDMTKLGGGLLDNELKEGFNTNVIEFKCGEGWVNPGYEGQTFAEAFSGGY